MVASRFLTFRLFAPLASWGDVAVGEFRPSLAHPTKSAVLGLVAGALGIRRSAHAEQEALRVGYAYGVRIDSPGAMISDYHTVETPYAKVVDQMARKGDVAATRRDELRHAGSDRKTNLSRREYRMDVRSVVALWPRPGTAAPWSLEAIAAALQRPGFVPYLGRKSCSPGLPFAPAIVDAVHPVQALLQAQFPVDEFLEDGGAMPGLVQVRWEGDADDRGIEGLQGHRIERRRDEPLSRTSWLFADREEHVASGTLAAGPKKDSHVPQPC